MKANFQDKKFIGIIGLLVFLMVVSWSLFFSTYVQQDTVNIHLFPKEFAGWKAEEVPISDEDYRILETRNAFTRKYTGTSGQAVYIFIVYSQNNRKVSHPPEICYVGSGATIVSHSSARIKTGSPAFVIRVNRLVVEQGGDRQVLYYWFKVGNAFTSNYWRQQILIALKTFLGQPASSALIRLSAPVKADNIEEANQNIEEFVRLITPDLFRYLP